MAAKLTFWGAAGQVTGSMHLLEAAGARILLDSGLFQGHRAEANALNRNLPFDPRRIDAIVVSHAHIDHNGRLPLLVRHGFHGPIFATPATRDLCAVMLPDSAHIQEKDFEYLQRRDKAGPQSEPLYSLADAVAAQELMVGVPYRRITHLRKHLALEFVEAGHILGSASVDLRITEDGNRRIVFSGDIGRSGLPIIRDPEPPSGPVDALIIESTYADRTHESVAGAEEHLGAAVRRTAGRGGKVLIPAFALGRCQEVIYSLHRLHRAGKIPEVPIYIDSPLAIDATTVFAMHPEIFDQTEDLVQKVQDLFRFPLVRYTREATESKALNTQHGPMVIIAASGMVEAGRILHHLAHGASDQRNTILIVGFQAEHTLGRRIVERVPVLRVFGDEVPLRAHVEVLAGYSAHGDRHELQRWLDSVRDGGASTATPRKGQAPDVYLVHGEPDAQDAFADQLRAAGYPSVEAPVPHRKITL